MGLFDKLFGNKTKPANPDKSKLLKLLEIYKNQNGKRDSYKNVVLELMNGNSFLLLPSQNDDEGSASWTTAEKDTTLKLTCVYNLDGLKVLGAFTDETSLLAWAKKPTQYTALASKDVLKLCEEQLIERIVVNSDLPTMFVLERNRANIKTETIQEETTVQVGTPNRPLERRILQKLIDQFQRVETIDEVYQYGQAKNNEFSIVLGFKLLTNSDNAKTATINAVQTALQGEKIDQLLDLFFIEDEGWYQTIRNVENSFFYKR
ncbi:SseB family protein [Chitinophagaceae bacterium 26-R-25]|nr:SseB family protein [Chitinophagaceae bacterium 26-R-25]